MGNSIIGIELGNTNIKIIETKKKGKGLFLKTAAIIETPPATLLDGSILAVDQLAEVIQNVISAKKIKAEEAVVLITSPQIATRDTIINEPNKKGVAQFLKYGANDYFPMALDEYQVNFHITGTTEDSEGKHQNVTLVATPIKIVESTIYLLTKLKLKPIGMTFNTAAIANAFKKETGLVGNQEDEILVVDLGGTATRFTTVSVSGITSTKEISFSSEAMSDLIRRQFNGNEPIEIEAFKKKYGHIYLEGKEDENDHYGCYISNIVKSSIDYDLVSEITRFIRLYESRTAGKQPITKIYLMGGGANLKNLDRYIEHETGIKTVNTDFIESILTSTTEDLSEYLIYSVALLSACTGQCVNLLPENFLKKEQNKRYGILLLGLVAAELLLAGTRAYAPVKGIKDNNSQLIALEAQITDPKFDAVREIQQTLDEKNKAIDMMQKLFHEIPKDTFITGMLLDNVVGNVPLGVTIDTARVAKEENTLTLSGKYNYGPNALGYFSKLQNLYPEAAVTFTLGEVTEETIYADYNVTMNFVPQKEPETTEGESDESSTVVTKNEASEQNGGEGK